MNNYYGYTPPPKPDDILHYGIKRRSGRYPWGSGDKPFQSLSGGVKKERQIRDTYNYKESESYRTGTPGQKAFQTNMHNKNALLYGEKKANQIDYAIEEKGLARKKAQRNMFVKEVGKGAAILLSATLIPIGLSMYDKYKSKIELNNVVVDLYAMTEGLNTYNETVTKMNISDTINAINIGKKALQVISH